MTADEIAAWVAAIAAVGAIYYSGRLFWLQRNEERQRTLPVASGSRFAMFLNPARFVGAYAVKTRRYLPISQDTEIQNALANGSDILIMGRGGQGKSHSAVHHIRAFALRRWYQRWRVLLLDRSALQPTLLAMLPRRRYIVFFDDIDNYIAGSDGYDLLEAVGAIRDAAKEVRVVATVRSTTPQVDALDLASRVFARLHTIRLEDWTERQRDQLLAHTGVSPSRWDGTPLSAKQPSAEMEQVYRTLPPFEKRLLSCAKVLDEYGLHFCDRRLLVEISHLTMPDYPENDTNSALANVAARGFLKREDEYIQVYSPYLEFMNPPIGSNAENTLFPFLLSRDFSKELFIVAKARFYKEDISGSQEMFQEFVRREPDNEVGRYRLAVTYLRQQNWNAAREQLEAALSTNPAYLSALFRLSKVYARLGDGRAAEKTFSRARAVQQGLGANSLLGLSEMLMDQGDLRGALTTIDIVLRKDPDVERGWGIKGQILMRLGDDAAAKEAFDEGLSRHPDAFVYFGLGQIERHRRNWDGAAEYFKKACELYPTSGQAFSLLGQCFQQTNRFDEAKAAFETAIELGSHATHFGLALLFRGRKLWEEAARHFYLALEHDSKNGAAYSYLGDALFELKRPAEGMAAYRSSIEIDPHSKHFRYSYAQALSRVGRNDEALAELDRSLKIDPAFAPARRLKGQLLR